MTEEQINEIVDNMPLISRNELFDFLCWLSASASRHDDDMYYIDEWIAFCEFQDAEIEARHAVKH